MKQFVRLSILVLVCTPSLFNAQGSDDSLNIFLREYKFEKVVELLTRKNQTESLNANENFILGIAYQNLFKFPEAETAYSNAVKQNPDNEAYQLSLGKLYAVNENFNKAEQTFLSILSFNLSNTQAQLELASLYFGAKRYKDAAKFYSQLIKKDSTNTNFLKMAAFAFSRIDSIALAKKLFLKSIENAPTDAFAPFHLAKIYFDQNKFDSTEVILDASLKHNRRNPGLNKLLAEADFKNKNYDGAIIYYNNAILYGDSSAAVYQKLGYSYYLLANSESSGNNEIVKLKYGEALKALLKSNDLEDDNPLTTFYIGISYKQLDSLALAEKFLNHTIDLIFPDYLHEVYAQLGFLMDSEGRFPEAIANYKAAYEQLPSKKLYLFYLASVFDRYYADRSVPLLYYKKYLKEKETENTVVDQYAEERVEALTEQIHFGN